MIEGELKNNNFAASQFVEIPKEPKIIIPEEFLSKLEKISGVEKLARKYDLYRYFALKQLFGRKEKTQAELELDIRYLYPGGIADMGDPDEADIASTVVLIEGLQRKSTNIVKVLEIGAGQTYGGDYDCWKPPHKSRAAAIYFGEKVDITISDIKSDKLKESFIIIESDQESPNDFLHIKGVGINNEYLNEPTDSVSSFISYVYFISDCEEPSPPQKRFSPEKMYEITKRTEENMLINEGGIYRFLELNRKELDMLIQSGFNLDVNGNKKYFVRPVIDRLFEKLAFGLNAKGGADFYDLEEAFKGEKFDLIYSTRLEPEIIKDKIKTSNILKPGGKIKIEKDYSY
jgi:hypothetical protein